MTETKISLSANLKASTELRYLQDSVYASKIFHIPSMKPLSLLSPDVLEVMTQTKLVH